MCDACRSEGVDATTWHAASLLDASIPADVGRVYVIWAVDPFKVFREQPVSFWASGPFDVAIGTSVMYYGFSPDYY